MANKNKNSNKRSREMRKFVEAGGQNCMEFFRHLASSQQWREHGTLPPLSNDEAMILNHMYQIWLSQSPEEKAIFIPEEELEEEEDGYGRHFRDTLQQPPIPPLQPPGRGARGSSQQQQHRASLAAALRPDPSSSGSSQTVSVSLCISTIKNSLAKHEQHSDSLLNLVNQLDVLVKAPEPTRTHANDLLVMLLSPDFVHRDLAALERRVDLVSSLQQQQQQQQQQHKHKHKQSAEQRRDREVHLAVAAACCVLLALLAESEHLITERYKASLPPPFQRVLAHHHQQQQQGAATAEVKRLYDDIATSYYLRSLTIAFKDGELPEQRRGGGSAAEVAAAAPGGAGGRNSIAAMQLGSKYLRGGVEQGARLCSPQLQSAGQGHSQLSEVEAQEQAAAVLRCEQDYRQAFQWFLQAALLENPIAQHKVGYFYDEGLPLGACQVHIMEAVKWYSRAAELMPDSMHNLAKIYEDGRGGFEADLKQAVTLYSVAAARGFPLSQVNLGRLFLLGEDGVRRDREAGKRLLTLAAESGDADAQMVVGMIHATPAFECFDLALSEHWLCCSLAGGKQDAERLLGRVRQQLEQQQQQQQQQQQEGDKNEREKGDKAGSLSALQAVAVPGGVADRGKGRAPQPCSQLQLARAAKQRGEDFRAHDLLHAAVLEFSRAFELDRGRLGYFVDRLETLFMLGHFEECLSDSSLLLDCVDERGEKLGGPHGGGASREQEQMGEEEEEGEEESGENNSAAMKRLFAVLSKCLSYMHSDSNSDADAEADADADAARRRGAPDDDSPGAPETFFSTLPSFHRDALVRCLLLDCLELAGGGSDEGRGQGQGLGAARASAFLAHVTLADVEGNRSVVSSGGVPMLLAALHSVSRSLWQSATRPVAPLSHSLLPAPAQMHSSLRGALPLSSSSHPRREYAFVREQLWLNCLVTFQHLLNPPMVAFVPPLDCGGEEQQQERHMARMRRKKLAKRRSLVQLVSAADGFSTLTNCSIACLQAIIQTAVFRSGEGGGDSEALPATTQKQRSQRRDACSDNNCDNNDDVDHDDDNDDHDDVNEEEEEEEEEEAMTLHVHNHDHDLKNQQQQLHYFYFRDCIALTRTTTTIMQVMHCISTVADLEQLWPELLRGGLVRSCSCALAASVLTAQLQLAELRRGTDTDTNTQRDIVAAIETSEGTPRTPPVCGEDASEEEEAPVPRPLLLKEDYLVGSPAGREQGGGMLPFPLQLGHACISLRHLAHSVEAVEQLLAGAPLEVLLSLSASDAMAALFQILRMLAPLSSPSSSAPVNGGVALYELAAAVHRDLQAAREPIASPSSSSSQAQSSLLALSEPASALLGRMDSVRSAQVLGALLLPLRPVPASPPSSVPSVSDGEAAALLCERLADMSPAFREVRGGRGRRPSRPSRSSSGRCRGDSGAEDVLRSLCSLRDTVAELRAGAAACLCALLCARDPRRGELLKHHFAPEHLDNFLWLVLQHQQAEAASLASGG